MHEYKHMIFLNLVYNRLSFLLQIRLMSKPGRADKLAVCVGTVTDDMRIFKIPKLKVNSFISSRNLYLVVCVCPLVEQFLFKLHVTVLCLLVTFMG